MVTSPRAQLDERLVVWQGPPPVDLAAYPAPLARPVTGAGADTVVVDSLKDAGSGLDDEGGTGWNGAWQRAVVAGVPVVELHHNRKAIAGAGRRPDLDDVYGSRGSPRARGRWCCCTGSLATR